MPWLTDKGLFFAAVLMYGISSVYSVFLWRRGFQRDDHINYFLLLFAFGLHSGALFGRGFSFNRCPVNNLYEAIAFVSWTITATILVVGLWPRLRFLGAFASPVLFGMGVFGLFPELDAHSGQAEFVKGWSSLHAAVILLAYGAFGLASVAAFMYLSQEHNLKFRKLQAVFAILPPMQRLEQVIDRLLCIGWVLLTLGLAVGSHGLREQTTRFSFWDVKVIWSILVWGLYLSLLVLRWRSKLGGKRFARSTVGGFAFVLLTFWGTNLMSAIHQQH